MDTFDIKAWRERMGFSQAEAAKELNANFFTYRNWDQGLIPVPGTTERLCQMIEEKVVK